MIARKPMTSFQEQWTGFEGGQRVGIPGRCIHRRPLTLQVPRRQFAGRGHLGPVGPADPLDILHLLQEKQALVFGSHGTFQAEQG